MTYNKLDLIFPSSDVIKGKSKEIMETKERLRKNKNEIMEMYAYGFSRAEIAKRFGFCQPTITTFIRRNLIKQKEKVKNEIR